MFRRAVQLAPTSLLWWPSGKGLCNANYCNCGYTRGRQECSRMAKRLLSGRPQNMCVVALFFLYSINSINSANSVYYPSHIIFYVCIPYSIQHHWSRCPKTSRQPPLATPLMNFSDWGFSTLNFKLFAPNHSPPSVIDVVLARGKYRKDTSTFQTNH